MTRGRNSGGGTVQEYYDNASVIALVNIHGEEVEVIRSWKTELPRWIEVPLKGDGVSCAYGARGEGIYLLYLYRSKEGRFSTSICSGNLHESARSGDSRSDRDFRKRIQWLETFGVEAGRD